jgi:hypothetical protein
MYDLPLWSVLNFLFQYCIKTGVLHHAKGVYLTRYFDKGYSQKRQNVLKNKHLARFLRPLRHRSIPNYCVF